MKQFPDILNVSSKNNFPELLKESCLSLLRKDIFDMIIRGNESTFYDIDTFNRQHVHDMKKTEEMVQLVCEELAALGWKTFLGFGGTGLYVYSSEEKPVGAY